MRIERHTCQQGILTTLGVFLTAVHITGLDFCSVSRLAKLGRSLVEDNQRQQQRQQQQQQQQQNRHAPSTSNTGKKTEPRGNLSSTQAHQSHHAKQNGEQNGAEVLSSAPTNSMTIDDVGLFAALYPDLPEEDGLKASRNERLSNGYRSITLTYGEVSASGFLDILARVGESYGGLPKEGGVFFDLGCGTGKPVFAAAAAHPWHRCIGVEILGDLHSICQKALERWKGGLKDAVTVGGSKGATAEIEFVKGDFTVLDWSDGDVVFANSTCFDDDLMKKTAKAVASLKEGAIVITTTDTVPSPALEVLEETVMVQAGRSATTCFIQRRLPKAPPAFDPA